MSLEYDPSKFNDYKRAFLKNPKFNPITGKKIDKDGPTYNKLVTEFGYSLKEFHQFTDLPPDIQNVILTNKSLVKSQRLSPSINKITQDTYYHQLCDKPITDKELVNYIDRFYPDQFFLIHTQTCEKFISSYDGDTKTPRLYKKLIEKIQIKKKVEYVYYVESMDSYIIDTMENANLDLLSAYFIYLQRRCESIKPQYAKHRVQKHLDDYYHTIDFTKYSSVLCWYLYLRVNLQRFPVLLPKNDFVHYKVIEKNGITGIATAKGHSKLNRENLMDKLLEESELFHDLLINQLDKLE